MRIAIKYLTLIFPLLFSLNLIASEISINYPDKNVDITYSTEHIKAVGYMIDVVLDKKSCNPIFFETLLNQINYVKERLDSKLYDSKKKKNSIYVSTDINSKMAIALSTEFGKKVLDLRRIMFLAEAQKELNCPKK